MVVATTLTATLMLSDPLDISPAALTAINADTQFRWTGSTEVFSAVEIEIGFLTNDGFLDVFCVARDDGEFSFPQNIKDQIGSLQVSSVLFARSAFNTVTNGSSRLLIFNDYEL